MAPGGGQTAGSGDSDFVVVANRLPIDMERLPDGSTEWKRSPGGLVTALEPLLRRRSGAWIGWAGVPDADEDPIDDDGLQLYPVRLSADDIASYYEGFSNATLWPLYHDLIVKPIYHREWWDSYVEVNRRFAEATAKAAAPNATVWVQDYQLQLVPKMLRMLRPDLTIGFFLHIPFPPVEIFMQMPWRTEIVEGLLGADLVGFHLPGGAQNFLVLARRLVGANTSRASVGVRSRFGEVQTGFRTVKVGAFPISIDSTALDQQARSRAVRQRARQIRSELGNPRKILLGVDRLDYTKGIDVRLRAFSELLAEHRAKRDDTVLVQLATPSRERVESYKEMREDIERQVGHINGEYGEVGHPIVHYIHRPVPRDELIAFFADRGRHAGHPATRRDEPGRQGVCGLPQRPRWRAGAQRIHRRRSRTPSGLPDQPASPRGRQGHDRGRAESDARRGPTTDARPAQAGSRARRGPLGTFVPGCVGLDQGQRG